LDRYARLAAELPDVPFVAHVTEWDRYGDELAALASQGTANLGLLEPVYGEAKVQLLASARAYVHLARWEAFGLSIVEAAAAGVPLVVSSEIDLAEDIAESGAGLVVDLEDWSTTVEGARRFLRDEDLLLAAGDRARAWARASFASPAVGGKAESIYAKARP
jgi:glycosyltransferase involved in cell wall biosynthesis